MTGRLCFLRMRQSFALTLRIDVLECGEHVTNILHQFVSLNMTVTARARLWYVPKSACKGKRYTDGLALCERDPGRLCSTVCR